MIERGVQVTVEMTQRPFEATERHVRVGAAVEAALDAQRHVAVLASAELHEREVLRRCVRTVALDVGRSAVDRPGT